MLSKNRTLFHLIANLILAIGIGIFPVIFLASENIDIVNAKSVLYALLIYGLLFSLMFIIFYFLQHKNADLAIISVFIFAIGFHFYGLLYTFLVTLDLFSVDHTILLPFVFLLTITLARYLPDRFKANSITLRNRLAIIIAGLVIVNVLVPVVNIARKAFLQQKPEETSQIGSTDVRPSVGVEQHPDIYYIVADETVDISTAKNYWTSFDAATPIKFFTDEGFFIANKSRSRTLDTLVEVANRLNMREYSVKDDQTDLFHAISNNKVMQTLKEIGYQTIVIDEARSPLAYETKPPIQADFDFSFDWSKTVSYSFERDPFFQIVAQKNMLFPFINTATSQDVNLATHREDVLSAYQKIGNLSAVKSPKMIYAHMMVSHRPFIFDADGSMLDPSVSENWNYYIQSYEYQIKRLMELVRTIKSQYPADHQPVIIIQGDHGARNSSPVFYPDRFLAEYPEDDKYSVINLMYLPNYDYSQLQDNFDPINTFPIIFNHYFEMNIPLVADQ